MGFFGGSSGGGGAAATVKSVVRTEWDQGNSGTFSDGTIAYPLWSASPSFNDGSLFTYHADYNSTGHLGIEVNANAKVGFNISLGSQGASWLNLSLITLLLTEENAGVVDVFYELPVPASGSLYPNASLLIREVTAGEVYYPSLYVWGDNKEYGDFNTLSAFIMYEV